MTDHHTKDTHDYDAETFRAFKEAVNTTPKQLEKWLDTDESREVGQKSSGGGGESVGHQSAATSSRSSKKEG